MKLVGVSIDLCSNPRLLAKIADEKNKVRDLSLGQTIYHIYDMCLRRLQAYEPSVIQQSCVISFEGMFMQWNRMQLYIDEIVRRNYL